MTLTSRVRKLEIGHAKVFVENNKSNKCANLTYFTSKLRTEEVQDLFSTISACKLCVEQYSASSFANNSPMSEFYWLRAVSDFWLNYCMEVLPKGKAKVNHCATRPVNSADMP